MNERHTLNKGIIDKTAKGAFWLTGEKALAEMMSFIVSVVLARMLGPNTMGSLVLVLSLISVLQVFASSGFSDFIVKRIEINEQFISSVAVLNVVVASALYAIMFALAVPISNHLKMGDWVWVIRILSLRLIISAFNSIQKAIFVRRMEFSQFFYATLFGTVISAIVGLALALCGCGVWAIVAQNLLNIFVDTIWLQTKLKMRILTGVNFVYIKETFEWGIKLVASSLLGAVYSELRTFIVGLFFSTSALAFYNYGKKIPGLIANTVSGTMNDAAFPVYAMAQNDQTELREVTRKITKMEVYVMAPCFAGLFAIAPNLILILFGEKWIDAGFYLRVFSLCYMFDYVTSSYAQVLKTAGKTSYIFKIALIVTIENLVLLFVFLRIFNRTELVAIAVLIGTYIEIGIYMFYVNKGIGYTVSSQIRDYGKLAVVAIVDMIIVVSLGAIIHTNAIIVLIVQILVGISAYVLLSKILKINEYLQLMGYLKGKYKEIFR